MVQRTNIRRGMAVMSSDGVQMGRVIDVEADAIVVEKGQFFLRDFRIPLEDIHRVRGDEILLSRGHAALRQADSEPLEGTANGTVGVAGHAAPPPQGLGLGPTDLTEARMDSAKFQDHERYDFDRKSERTAPPAAQLPQPHEPPMTERRAAGPGWDPLSVDEEQEELPLTSPDPKAPTRY